MLKFFPQKTPAPQPRPPRSPRPAPEPEHTPEPEAPAAPDYAAEQEIHAEDAGLEPAAPVEVAHVEEAPAEPVPWPLSPRRRIIAHLYRRSRPRAPL